MGGPTRSLGSEVTSYAPTDGGPVLPPRRPITMAATLAEAEAAAMPGPEIARVVLKPVSYLSRNTGIAGPVTISLGGADAARPNPLSGTVVGGGRAPLPRPRPVIEIAVASATVAPEDSGPSDEAAADAPETSAMGSKDEDASGEAAAEAAALKLAPQNIPDDAAPAVEPGAPDVVDEGSGDSLPAPVETFAVAPPKTVDQIEVAAIVAMARDIRAAGHPSELEGGEASARPPAENTVAPAEPAAADSGSESPDEPVREPRATEPATPAPSAGHASHPVLRAAPDCLPGPAAAAVSEFEAASFLPARPAKAAFRTRRAKPDDLPMLDPDKPVFARSAGGVALPARRPRDPVPLARPAPETERSINVASTTAQ